MPAQLARAATAAASWVVCTDAWDHEVHAPLHWARRRPGAAVHRRGPRPPPPVALSIADRRAEIVVAGRLGPAASTVAGDAGRRSADSAGPPGAPARRSAAGEAPRRIETLQRRAAGDARASARARRSSFKGARGDAGADVARSTRRGFDPKKKYPLLHSIHGGPHAAVRRQLPLPLEQAGVRRAGLCRRLRQLPRLERLRLRLPRQHHAPLGRARAAGHRGRHRLAAEASPGPTASASSPPAAATAASWWRG